MGLVFEHGVRGMIFSTASPIRSRLATVIGSGAFGHILRRRTPGKQSSLPHVRDLLDGRSRAARQRKAGRPERVKRGPMSQHKFKVGQFVDYNAGRLGMSASALQYKILRLLPAEGGDLLYRIKSIGEAFERVAKERELARREQ